MWVLLALLTAAGTAVRDAASKHATRALDPIVVGCGISAIPGALLAAWVLGDVVRAHPAGVAGLAPGAGLWAGLLPGPGFLTALAVSGGINAVTTPLIVWALKRSDLSLMAPLTSITPLFMIPVAAVVLGEAPSLAGGFGVAVIVVGAYLLNVSDRAAGPLAPFAALARDPGARAMLLVAFLYSISGTYDKVGVQASSPLFWAAALQLTIAILLAPIALRRWGGEEAGDGAGKAGAAGAAGEPGAAGKAGAAGPPGPDPRRAEQPSTAPAPSPDAAGIVPVYGLFRRPLRPATAVLLAGLVTAIAAAAQMTALTLTLVAYVIAVKRTSTLFSVLLGHSLFREEGVGERLLGAIVMLAGFLLVTLH